jgi:membrane-bound serine protease (ClpP class)
MPRLIRFFLTVFVCSAALASDPIVRVVTFDSEITRSSARRIERAIDDAAAASDNLVLIEMDTPGGVVDTTEDLVKKILASKVPVAVWVGPAGARAASGGFYLLIAADVAAMAPGTRTGAAAAIYGMGKSDEGDILLKKLTNDLAALARSIAEHRGRDVASCEKAVSSAESFTDEAALKSGLVDLVAKDRAALLGQLDGRTIKRFDGTTVTLSLAHATFVESETTRSQRIEDRVGGFLDNPTVVFLLLMIGAAGLYAEFNHPGAWVPGLVGAVALILFFFGAQVLPVSAVGLLLLVLGLVLFVLEMKFVSHGLLTVGGVFCVVLGSVLLFPGKGGDLRPPLAVVLPGSLTLAALCILATRLAVQARLVGVQTGVEGLKGEIGVAREALAPEGTVFVHGELWQAHALSGPVPAGARVRIVNVRELVVDVEPVDAAH